MSITSDRTRLADLLGETVTLTGDTYTIAGYRPPSLRPYTIWCDLASVEPGCIFGSIESTWAITATVSAKLSTRSATVKLDTVTDWILEQLTTAKYGRVQNIDEYYTIQDPSNGAAQPAVTIYITSTSRIGA
ncbi:MAG: hypothetical protein PUK40_02125 [Actinomycetaceae bacterium]|nr:hypothetical protein [Arcanobacterium sp.]MDD7504738.1 hypothetical protein [Actinomycetaceae bacterium]MDY6142739.1 hypothetical protein [Arcanobacterium sp.]